MRLLYLHYGPQSGVTASMARALADLGEEVLLANPTERFLYQLRPGLKIPNPRPAAVRGVAEAIRAHGARWKAGYLHTRYAFDHLSALAAQAVRRARPDAVLQAGVLFGTGAAPGAPVFLYLDHTWALSERYPALPGLPPPPAYDPAWRAREEAVYRHAAGIFTMSEPVRRSLRDDYGVDPARVQVVGAGPNVTPGPSDLGLAREARILFVGRTFGPKGGPALLEAFAALRRARPALRLDLVTADPPGALPAGATAHGLLGREALARRYATAAVLAHPTLREAFGLVLLEAMAFALPVVASGIEAIPEVVEAGETGLLVPPGDAAALAGALGALLDDPPRARRMGEAGRARALARYGWERAAAAVVDEVRRATGRAEAAAG